MSFFEMMSTLWMMYPATCTTYSIGSFYVLQHTDITFFLYLKKKRSFPGQLLYNEWWLGSFKYYNPFFPNKCFLKIAHDF